MVHISLSGEVIGAIGSFQVTNSILTTWLVMIFLTTMVIIFRSSISSVPSHFQSFFEILVGSLYTTFESLLGERTRQFFPLIATLFIFILFSNLVDVLPGVNSIVVKESAAVSERGTVPLFRPPTADLNTTLGLAIISILAIQFFSLRVLGVFSHFGKYISFKDPLSFFVGVLEIIQEFSRILSFSFRLFGNIFAGEVLLSVMAFLMPLIVPIPFLGLELFVAFIQALVFSMLTAVFLSLAIAKH